MALFSDLGETIHDALQRIMVLVIAALVALYLYKKYPPAAEEEPVDLNSDELVDLPDEVDGLTGTERENQVLIISESDAQCTVETEIIEDEMQKQLRKCTCAIPLRMHRLGGGRYRMSNSSRLCLVRILRSTVMVRVGGGWVSLNEFLIKNDPCRVRLTNLGSNINGSFAQHMVHFKAKQPVR